ncbi:MAG TPA: hypothetical protein VGW38_21830 [Chloroflexota bacterium]|nr:hypothetical protein [Chloroflexota bacterium]
MVNTPFKRGLAALGIAVALGGTAVGVVGAQQAPNVTPTPRSSTAPQAPGAVDQRHEQFLSALAGKLGVSADRLRQAIADARTELGFPAQGGLPGFRGLGGPGGRRGGFGFHGSLDAAATAIGISGSRKRAGNRSWTWRARTMSTPTAWPPRSRRTLRRVSIRPPLLATYRRIAWRN